MTEPQLRWVRWADWWSHDSSTTRFASVLVTVETGVIRASAEYAYEYYGGWFGGGFQRLVLLHSTDGSTEPASRPPRLPAGWPPPDGYDAGDFTPRLFAVDTDGTSYAAQGNRIDANDLRGRPLWSVTLDFSEPPRYGGREPSPPLDVRWLEPGSGCLYVLTAANTVASLSGSREAATPYGLGEQDAFAALVADDPDTGRLLAALDEKTWTSLIETAYRAKTPGQAVFDAYFGGPDCEVTRRRWYDRTSLAHRKELVIRAESLPQDLTAILRLPALESLVIAERESQRYTRFEGMEAIGAFVLSHNRTA